MGEANGRVFLFLQGPHGPLFAHLAAVLAARGATVRRVAFNAADEAEWARAGPLDPFLGAAGTAAGGYEAWLGRHLERHGVTDIVLYGDSRPEHALAVALAWQRGLVCHCLEEGYLRPHWVTYERWGNNGRSPLTAIPLERMAAAVGEAPGPGAPPPDGWGAWGPHLRHSLRYHLRLALPSRRYGRYRSRRGMSLWHELGMYLRRLAGLPLRRALHRRRMRRLAAGGRPWHLVLLQLSFDASMQCYSDYRSSAEFVRDCLEAFAEGAAPDDLLVFKSHPFEDGRERLGRLIAREARGLGLAGRVVFLDGGNGLAEALDGARSVVTVNSTGAQQALCRGLPVAALGHAVYVRRGLTSDQPLAAFFAAPEGPDPVAYGQFRRFLLASSQIEGSFYSRPGIEVLLERLPTAMLSREDPYERLLARAQASERTAAAGGARESGSAGSPPNRGDPIAEPRRLAG